MLSRSLSHPLSRNLLLTILTGLTVTSCSIAKDAGLSLGLTVSPTKAYIVPGSGASCMSYTTAKADGTIPESDVTGDRVLFSRLALQWRSDDKLTIAAVTATIFSSGIAGAETTDGLKITLSEEETKALLGLSNLVIVFASPYPSADPLGRKQNIDSTDAAAKGVYAACGLHLGGLSSKVGLKTYTARIKIELIGYKTKCELVDGVCTDGEQSPVRQSVTVTAEKF